MTFVKNVAAEGEICGNDGARNPRPQFALKAITSDGEYFRPNFGVFDDP